MADALSTTIIDAPVEQVWAVLRDFNGLPVWNVTGAKPRAKLLGEGASY